MVWNASDITQLGYACGDLDAAIAYFVGHVGAGPFYVMDVPPDAADYTFRGRPVTGVTRNRVAFGYRGRDQFELIETDNPVFDHLRRGREIAFHHCMQMSDRFAVDRQRYADAGFATLGTAQMPGVLIHYIDTMDRLGYYTELFDYHAAIRDTGGAMFAAFEVMHRAAEGWDGDRPVRQLTELF